MRSSRVVALLAVVALAGCAEQGSSPMEADLMVLPVFSHEAGQTGHQFSTHMTGAEEVPPNDSRARGQTILRLSPDGTELSYRLIVANIQNVTMTHIHLAPPGVNGPVVAWLYPDGPPAELIPGRSSGILATGVITAEDLVGPLAGATLADLLEEMRAGNTYVNVHTSQYPAGEIRGQIRPAGRH
jgi:hypothetical protein